ncbi:hypothetical protein K470DRAFT_261120 [Piedraia hortae CBS 480.64]|uniref:Protein kinase domain-containing protein n=1 Tax=Piedraia hortae CBS 480.64 TaxID=1314780 RepID=A0A6A7BQR7_9PEZI|nr:hypothetical protein K470DRAFT_261120 [Piedraia hortae CBS 480.64]
MRRGNFVHKTPYVILDNPSEVRKDLNEWNIAAVKHEIAIYKRIWPYPGLVGGFEIAEDCFVIDYLPRGSLECSKEDKNNQRPNDKQMHAWYLELAKTYSYIHKCKVFVADIAARNVLVANDDSLKVVDFGTSDLFPENWEGPLLGDCVSWKR